MRKFKFNLASMAFVLGIGLASVTVFSSFTKTHTKSGQVTNMYYNITGSVGDTDPADFIYTDGGSNKCDNSSKECLAVWATDNAPTPGQNPTQAGNPSRVDDSGLSGTYDP